MEKQETSSTVMVFQFIRGLIEKWTICIFIYIFFYKHVTLVIQKEAIQNFMQIFFSEIMISERGKKFCGIILLR